MNRIKYASNDIVMFNTVRVYGERIKKTGRALNVFVPIPIDLPHKKNILKMSSWLVSTMEQLCTQNRT